MTRLSSVFICVASAVVIFVANRPILAADEQPPVKLTLHPAPEPIPALRYRLLPGYLDQTRGNAAVPYGKVTAEEMTFFGSQEQRDKVDRWQEMPLEELRGEKMILPKMSLDFLEQGARCSYCDWQLPIGDVPFYTMVLPDAQQSRSFARLLAVKARREIAEGKLEDAIKTFQTSYALARNIAEGETLIHGLIGIAMCSTTHQQAMEFVQQPGAPNLYWALTQLPDPLIDVNEALQVESQGIELSFPELGDLEHASRTPEAWRDLFHRFADQVIQWTATSDPPAIPRKTPEELDALCRELLPTIQRTLVAAGMTPDRVEAMPLHHAALVYTLNLQHRYFDDAVKFYQMPYPQSKQQIEATIQQIENPADGAREIIPVARHTMPAIVATRSAIARNDRHIAVLRVIEALRMYAAEHDGQLPRQLSDITEVPIPIDPVSDKAFEYKRDEEKALLQGPIITGVPLNYEITMVPSQ
jgi:hypothetical protein